MRQQFSFVLDPREANLALRLVFILMSMVKSVARKVPSLVDLQTYCLWKEFANLAPDIGKTISLHQFLYSQVVVTHLAVAISKGLKHGRFKVEEVRRPLTLLYDFCIGTVSTILLDQFRT